MELTVKVVHISHTILQDKLEVTMHESAHDTHTHTHTH
jgi:hypothetical protein